MLKTLEDKELLFWGIWSISQLTPTNVTMSQCKCSLEVEILLRSLKKVTRSTQWAVGGIIAQSGSYLTQSIICHFWSFYFAIHAMLCSMKWNYSAQHCPWSATIKHNHMYFKKICDYVYYFDIVRDARQLSVNNNRQNPSQVLTIIHNNYSYNIFINVSCIFVIENVIKSN